MRCAISVVESPEDEPVSLAEAKAHCRVSHDDEDALIGTLIAAARRQTEEHTGQRLCSQTLRIELPDWYDCHPSGVRGGGAEIALPVQPVSSVVSVAYYDVSGDLQSLGEDEYQAWLSHTPPILSPAPLGVWPGLQAGRIAPVRIDVVAGYGGPGDVPEHAKQAILLTVAHWYEHRGDTDDPSRIGLPRAALRLLGILSTGGYS